MSLKKNTFRTSPIERTAYAMTLAVLIQGASLKADTLVGPITIIKDEPAEFKAVGSLTATDTSDPENGIEDVTLDVIGTKWRFTLQLLTESWNDDGAVNAMCTIEGKHLDGPHENDIDPNTLPKKVSDAKDIDFDDDAPLKAIEKLHKHPTTDVSHFDKYALLVRATALEGPPNILTGPSKVYAIHGTSSIVKFPEKLTISVPIEDGATVTFDAVSGQLLFNVESIGGLDDDGGQSGGIAPEFAQDPILDGQLHIAPLLFGGVGEDGRFQFVGGAVEISDPLEEFALSVVLDDYRLSSTLPDADYTTYADATELSIDTRAAEDGDTPGFLERYINEIVFNEGLPPDLSQRLQGTTFSFETPFDLVEITQGFTQSAFDVPVTIRLGAGFAPACDGVGPVIVTGEDDDTHPCPGYIDPRIESSDGNNVNLGVDILRVIFDRPVRNLGSQNDILTPSAFEVRQTGGGQPPVVLLVASQIDEFNRHIATLLLNKPIALQEWTTVQAHVEDDCGQPIQNLGDLGEGVDEPDRVDIAFLPADINQDSVVTPFDLLSFRVAVNNNDVPEAACSQNQVDYLDINRDENVSPFDLLTLRQLITGLPPATQPWAGQSLNSPRP